MGPEPAYLPMFEMATAPCAQPSSIQAAVELLRTAERPLVITGKGAVYGRAENEALQFIT